MPANALLLLRKAQGSKNRRGEGTYPKPGWGADGGIRPVACEVLHDQLLYPCHLGRAQGLRQDHPLWLADWWRLLHQSAGIPLSPGRLLSLQISMYCGADTPSSKVLDKCAAENHRVTYCKFLENAVFFNFNHCTLLFFTTRSALYSSVECQSSQEDETVFTQWTRLKKHLRLITESYPVLTALTQCHAAILF